MNVLRTNLTLALLFLFFGSTLSQDLHFSQHFNSPLNISPGLTGVFNGDYRVVGNYKRQWQNVPVDYLTFSGAVDIKLDQYGGRNGNFNIGLLFDYDEAGDLELSLANIAGLVSYSIRLGKKNFITPGISLGFNQRRLKPGNATTGNQWNGFEFDPSIPAEVPFVDNISFADIALGANYRYQKGFRKFLDLGIGLNHLFSPSQTFEEAPDYEADLARRWNVYGMLTHALASKLDLIVNALYQNQNPHQEILLNAQAKIYLNRDAERDKALHLGIGTRLGDSFYPMIALQMGRWYGSASYDFTYSDFNNTVGGSKNGGLELHINYRFAKVPPVMFKPCPIY